MKPAHNKTYLLPYRKALRNKSTPAEASLWKSLKNSQLAGRKFRRQHSIDNYIVDFFCYEESLAIELDGGIHNLKIEQDKKRDLDLASKGIKVIRFENRFVFEHLDQVLDDIKKCFTPHPEYGELP
ncbi:MAG: endonuclease domain-containing protein [Bacteroidia bacterium]|nr:endonuclease domain-containing protein [Bacteroidia bacterium]